MTGATVLHVHTQGAHPHVDGDAVRLSVSGQPPRRLPLLAVRHIILFGSVGVTSDLVQRAGHDGIPITWLTREGRFSAQLRGPTTGNVLLRLSQYGAYSDPERRLRFAKEFVERKVRSEVTFATDSARYAQRTGRSGGGRSWSYDEHFDAVAEAGSIEQLMGVEGIAARQHFRVVAESLRTVSFSRRNRRPPTDPVNAVLSFLYTLLVARCVGAAETAGLDPQIGMLHEVRPGRPALALDLAEPYRAVADRTAVTMFTVGS